MSLTEKAHAWGFLLSEQDNGNLSRDNGTLISGQNLGAGTVLGKITLGTATAAAKAGGNSGNGTITMDGSTPVLAFADVGVYTVRCITAAANGGVFEVKNPTGRSLGTVTISGGAGGTGSFADQVKFVLTDGTGDFAVGDGFDITVAAGSGKLTQLAPAALDGSQYAVGILGADTDATSADKACAYVARQAEVNSNELVWPNGISAGNKATAVAQLAALGVISR